MKKLFLCCSALIFLSGCASSDPDYRNVQTLSVKFLQPTRWNGSTVPPSQSCRAQGGRGSTPPLYVTGIPPETNLIILEINNPDVPELAENGGNGSIGFYHSGEQSATLMPVPGETYSLPNFAFEEKASRVNPARPWPYMPPCIANNYNYSAKVKAVRRTGSFDKQKTQLLGIGEISLGEY